jgi:hypothetical protein
MKLRVFPVVLLVLTAFAFELSVSAADDFQTLCSAPGVVRCVGFDSPADIAGTQTSKSGILPGTLTTPQIDNSVFASGTGSLKFTIPALSDQNAAGSYFTNFSRDLSTQFGENSEFYVHCSPAERPGRQAGAMVCELSV